MTQTTTFARKAHDQTARSVRFVPALPRVHDIYLPERPAMATLSTVKVARWRTTRLRPEIYAVIEGLQDRFKGTRGVDLTASEVIAAALIEALPILTSRDFKG